jgi:hypothetical protein
MHPFFREPRIEVPKLLASAEGKPCMVQRAGVCNGRTDTTVWAHSNQAIHGKGKGLKSHDPFGAYACSACHDWLDRDALRMGVSREDRDAVHDEAMRRTQKYIWSNRIVRVA